MANLLQSDGNRLLRRLPVADYQRLVAKMRPVKLEFRQVLYKAGTSTDIVYFLNRGTASVLAIMDDGGAIEVATIGKEGVVGLGLLHAGNRSVHEVIVQIAGDGLRIDAEALEKEAGADSPLRRQLLLYQTAYLAQVSYSVACNGLHPVQQRCCRWLLMTSDRVAGRSLPLTHDFLGIMLGVRRASVTGVLGPLAEAGLIACSRGKIKILNRRGLEARACECYRKVKAEFDRLLG